MGLIQYIKETAIELKHTSWPTRSQTVAFTAIVVLVSLVVSIFLGVFDFVFSKLLNIIIS